MNIPDNYDQWEAHERKQEKWRSRFPTCDICGETLYEYQYKISGEALCKSCVDRFYKEEVDIDE